MENPLLILGIHKGITLEDIANEIRNEISMIESLLDECKDISKKSLSNGIAYRGTTNDFFDKGIEGILSKKFACELEPTGKYMSYEELRSLSENLNVIEQEGDTKRVFYSNFITFYLIQLERLKDEYSQVINNYSQNPESKDSKDNLYDLYIRLKYEEAISSIGNDVARRVSRSSDPEKDELAYLTALKEDLKYRKIHNAYEKVATPKARAEIIPEIFIKSRLGDPSLLVTVSPEFKERVIANEGKYSAEYIKQIADNLGASAKTREEMQLAENQNHEYSWGVIIDEPTTVMDGVAVNNADFQGRISVKHLGYFSSESLFSKRKFLRERFENTTIESYNADLGGKRYRFSFERHTPNPKIAESMRRYYYKNEATKSLYSNIYLVQKTDSEGRKREDFVFSPMGKETFEKGKIPTEFLANVYFSNYALDLAKANGGFAGVIVNTPKGLSISTAYSTEEIASSILYQGNSIGKVMDKTAGDKTWKEEKGSIVDLMLQHKNGIYREI